MTDGRQAAMLAAMEKEFTVFLRAIWRELRLPEPTRAQMAIAKYLQYGPKRKQIQAFRGVGKSWITAAYVIWRLWKDPERKVMIVSASKERADAMSIFIQRLIIEIPWLQHLKPKEEGRWTRVSFDVDCRPSQSPSVKSVGITGQLTGSRGNTIVFDDVEVPNNSLTEMMREKLLQLVTEAESVIIPEGDSEIVYLGTPQTLFTIYRKLAERGYRPMIWPARYPTPEKMIAYEAHLAPELLEDLSNGAEPGDPTDPARFDNDELLEREYSMGKSNFLLQFMLDTSLSDAERYPLKFADLIVSPVNPTEGPDKIVWCSDPRNVLKDLPAVGLPGDWFYSPMAISQDWAPYSETICAVDPSGRGLDETAAHFMSQRAGLIYLHECFATKDGYSDNTLREILRRCSKYKVTTLLIESNFGDGTVANLFQKMVQELKLNITIEERRATSRKEDRIIDTLEPVMNQHRLVIDPKVIEWDFASNPDLPAEERMQYMLMFQLSRICREKGALKRDDRLDALALGVSWFTDAMAISAQELINSGRREDWLDLQEAFLDDPMAAASHLALGFDLEMRRKARSIASSKVGRHHSWIKARP
jgi:hypothetical protein